MQNSKKHKKSEKDSAGEAVGFRGIVRDITERKHMEATLKKARNELEQRVEERTKELLKINKQLENEINERRQAEETLKEQTKTLYSIEEINRSGWYQLKSLRCNLNAISD